MIHKDRRPEHPSQDILLVTMPFGPLDTPSIGLSLLSAVLQNGGMSAKILYFNLKFAQAISPRFYRQIADGYCTDLLGEWVFGRALFGPEAYPATQDDAYLTQVLTEEKHALELLANIKQFRALAEEFLDDCLDELLAYSPKVVGFTSVYQQQIASLSLAKRIKEKRPEIQTVFGGPNVEGITGVEVLRQFPFVDVVVSGEGEKIAVELFSQLIAGDAAIDIPGVYTQENVCADLTLVNDEPASTPQIFEMDQLPYPAYEDFLAAWETHIVPTTQEDDLQLSPRLLVETSRGCWWGERKHCTFCGLNGAGMNYRSKSSQRAYDELVHLATTYPDLELCCVDNIMDMKYFKDLLPALAKVDLGLDLFYEIKANLRKEQVRLLSAAGIKKIQPGIESFSDRVLQLMMKGISGFQNIQLLKWCKEYDVVPHWNILWGFPGETADDYAEMEALLPKIVHLRPPQAAGSIRLDRFSPNYRFSEEFGYKNVTPFPGYFHIYPGLPESAVANLAYYFTYEYQEPRDVPSYTSGIMDLCQTWRESHRESDLFCMSKEECLIICDTRPNSPALFTQLTGAARALYEMCDSISNMRQMQKSLSERFGPITETEIRDLLQPLIDQAFMLHDPKKDTFLSLAISAGSYAPKQETLERLYSLTLSAGELVDDKVVVAV